MGHYMVRLRFDSLPGYKYYVNTSSSANRPISKLYSEIIGPNVEAYVKPAKFKMFTKMLGFSHAITHVLSPLFQNFWKL